MNRIAFTLPNVGIMELHEVEGIIWLEDGFLVIQVKRKLLGMMEDEPEMVKIEPSALRDIYLKRRMFKDRLVLVPKKRDLLDSLPGKHVSDVRLRIWRSKRGQVEQLIRDCLRAMLPENAL